MPPKPNIIRTEEDAWNVLNQWLNNEPIADVEFDGWPQLSIAITGNDYNSSLNTGQMSAFIDFKMVMGRAYAAIAHGAYDARRLRSSEEDELEFTTEVKTGSSLADTDFSPLVTAFSQIVTTHPHISLAAAIVLGLLFVSRPLIRQHLENKAKQIDSDERRKLIELVEKNTPQENAHVKSLDKAIARICRVYPQFAMALPDASHAHWRLTSSASDADKMTISGIELSQEQLEALGDRRSFRNAEVEMVEDTFQVLGVIRVRKNYRVQLRSKNLYISAMYKPPEMTDARARRLAGCITSSQLIKATIELKRLEKSHVIGRLMKFQLIQNAIGEAQED